jgi:hypothetical protein
LTRTVEIKIALPENHGFSASTTQQEDAEMNSLPVAVRVAPKQALTKHRIFPGFAKLIIPPQSVTTLLHPQVRGPAGRPRGTEDDGSSSN